jgi:hypothetical protein
MSEAAPQPDRPLRMERDVGVFTDLDALSRDTAIQTLKDSEAPIAQADALAATLTGPALKAVCAARVDLFLKGHTPENDDMLPLPFLPFEAQQHAALASHRIGLTGRDRDLVAAEQELALTAAFCLAAIDRLRAARERREA